jgi:hypothetical protein
MLATLFIPPLMLGVASPSPDREIRFEVRRSPGKGLGAFAMEEVRVGQFVCGYEGERLVCSEVATRYGEGKGGPYLFDVGGGEFIDGMNTRHFSRFINHAERGNLDPRTDGGNVRFFATRRIKAGDELCFDYGQKYWECSDAGPMEGTDSRIETIRLKRRLRQQNGVDGWIPAWMEIEDAEGVGGTQALRGVAAVRNVQQAALEVFRSIRGVRDDLPIHRAHAKTQPLRPRCEVAPGLRVGSRS